MSEDRKTDLRILVVDDEELVRRSLTEWFQEDGHEVRAAPDGQSALKQMRDEGPFDLALIDLKMPGMDGIELLERLLKVEPDLDVVVMTAYASVDTAVRALKLGAWDYVTKPFDPEVLSNLLRRSAEQKNLVRENRSLKQKLQDIDQPTPILGESPAIKRVIELVRNVAPTETSVLITGESGVGKELVARAIHANSPRAFMPLVVVNCGALAEGTLESELFGHERGAFTGAQYRHKGKFELADGGTLFLDEIGEISPHTQVELLRVLEEKRVVRLGGQQSVRADFRLVAATNRDLKAEVETGDFREDLFYRLNVFLIDVPPLRERREDIPDLVRHFISRLSRQMNRIRPRVDAAAMRQLEKYSWPGNVRELSNAVERAMVVQRGDLLRAEDFPVGDHSAGASRTESMEGSRSLAEIERRHIEYTLEQANWNISEVARILEVDRGTVYNKIKQYGLEHRSGK